MSSKLALKKSRVYLNSLRDPMNSLQKQKLMSYYSSMLFRRGKPTLNRMQNLV